MSRNSANSRRSYRERLPGVRRKSVSQSGSQPSPRAKQPKKRGAAIAVEVVISAPLAFVWADVEDISSHVDWMLDATEIRFLSERKRGVGTRFECDTKVGPLKLTDVMEITTWQHGSAMGVSHQGIVGGTGVFGLRASGSNTVFSWTEQLKFPWYFAGPLGALVARPVLKSIWRGNLRRLKARIEDSYAKQRYSSWGTQ